MADDDKSVVDAEKKETTTTGGGSTTDGVGKKKKRGIFSRIWNGLFRFHGDDFEKRLQYISKEEAMILTRMKKRSSSWRQTSRHLIIFSIVLEVIAVGYAIMTTRSGDLDWKTRAFRVLPMFLLPALSTAAYAGLANFNRICDRKDKKTLERLRAERQAKIDELKEKTNYYTTQQLIQRYDTDPAAKAAAATVLAAKLGADSGLKVSVGDDSNVNAATGRSKDVEYSQSNGLRNRRQVQNRSGSVGNMQMHTVDEETANLEMAEGFASEHNQVVVGHYQPQGPATNDGGWLARVAALLVGEDPSQSYALICGNCHVHNGLARKEDFPYVTYYCPHCHALNGPKQLEEHLGSVAPEPKPQQLEERLASVGPDAKPQQLEERLASVGPDAKSRQLEENLDSVAPDANLKPDDIVEAVSHTASPVSDSDPTSNNSAVKTGSEIEEVKEKVTSGDLDG